MGRRTWNYSVTIRCTRYKQYLQMMLTMHLGFLAFLLAYAFIDNCVGWIMGSNYTMELPPYNMSGLLLMAMDLFMAYFIGFFEELCFSLYVDSSWKNIMISILIAVGNLIFLYIFVLEGYRLQEYFFGIELWESGIDSIKKAATITGKEMVGMFWGGIFGKIILKRPKYIVIS